MSRYEEVRALLARAMAQAITEGLPAASPTTNERMAQAVCEWMAGLAVLYVTDDELAAILDSPETP
jgi:hypothetical protein